MLDQLSQHHIY